jgi:predicted esterase
MSKQSFVRPIAGWISSTTLALSLVLGACLGANAGLVAQASGYDPLGAALQSWLSLPPSPDTSEVAAEQREVVVQPARELQLAPLPERPGYSLYVPEGPDVPRQAVLVLHGMGDNGPNIAARILPFARAHNWVVIAPTIPYGDWRSPDALTGEELRLQPQLANLLNYVPGETGVKLSGRALLFGFSRGAQAALRFAMLYPERVEAVAALSAGTYTLPVRTVLTSAGVTRAPLPYGVADIEQLAGRGIDAARLTGVRFWIGVGDRDNNVNDVPRQWDPYVGNTRVERAARFASVLAELGCDAQVSVVPNAGHEISAAMVEQITGFLNSAALHAMQRNEASTTVAALPPMASRKVERGL